LIRLTTSPTSISNASGTTINTTGSGTLTWPSLTLEQGTINQGGADFFVNATTTKVAAFELQ